MGASSTSIARRVSFHAAALAELSSHTRCIRLVSSIIAATAVLNLKASRSWYTLRIVWCSFRRSSRLPSESSAAFIADGFRPQMSHTRLNHRAMPLMPLSLQSPPRSHGPTNMR